jgi:prophage regulatory protein
MNSSESRRLPDNGDQLRLIRLQDVIARTALSRSSIYRLELAGQFPKRVPLGATATGFVQEEVDQWIRARIAGREEATRERLEVGRRLTKGRASATGA